MQNDLSKKSGERAADAPLIVQGDRAILLDLHAPRAEECRNRIIPFAELERSPEHLHTYRISALSLWNAVSAGFSPEDALNTLDEFSRYPVPENVQSWIFQTANRFGKLILSDLPDDLRGDCKPKKSAETAEMPQTKAGDENAEKDASEEYLFLSTESPLIYKEILATKSLEKYLTPIESNDRLGFALQLVHRGTVKQELMQLGWPVKDEAPLIAGEPLHFALRKKCLSGAPLVIRDYQKAAGNALLGDMGAGTGFGTIVLPCGAGKTIVGMNIMERLQTCTLIITTNVAAVHQWIDELLDKTTMTKDDIAEYTGSQKDIKPVTIATYQILTWRNTKDSTYPHFSLFKKRAWGLVIYDEVHLLPAPIFRVTAEIQAIRRVGLTATLIREDGCENHVFSLVGPKRYDVPWKELETTGWIATAKCIEIFVSLPAEKQLEYATSPLRVKHRISGENLRKALVVEDILQILPKEKFLIIGQYISQLEEVAKRIKAPIITGKTRNAERDALYADFRSGKINVLVVSKVANFAIDLPEASVAIQISGTFGSRQEEAQRLGRILRPKQKTALFFSVVTADTVDEEFSENRQKFLAEQGYEYIVAKYSDKNGLQAVVERAMAK